ncbi:hypothetical protein Nmn1133_12050 [Halosegnis longus]|uniref:Uncharacterized protein n=1 Tax=Halosegnis longus TaxID=2216012 RepID=A0AAJ4RAV7_9EURY|nr:hypothetical protein Nmn1133_12050 [Salella cibi]
MVDRDGAEPSPQFGRVVVESVERRVEARTHAVVSLDGRDLRRGLAILVERRVGVSRRGREQQYRGEHESESDAHPDTQQLRVDVGCRVDCLSRRRELKHRVRCERRHADGDGEQHEQPAEQLLEP